MDAPDFLSEWLTEPECHAWGLLFAAPWDSIVGGMADKATAAGLAQQVHEHTLTWLRGTRPVAIYFFLDDPTDLAAVRRLFDDSRIPQVPVAFAIVRQIHERDPRGDVVFDIFRLSPQSYLTHENRVYTPPRGARAG